MCSDALKGEEQESVVQKVLGLGSEYTNGTENLKPPRHGRQLEFKPLPSLKG